jgi:hypothetical protein
LKQSEVTVTGSCTYGCVAAEMGNYSCRAEINWGELTN